MIKNFMIKYLSRRGYMVVPSRVPMLLVSGNAVVFSQDKLYYTIVFPTRPYLVALNGSYVNISGESQ
jgi:hypothetical protein